MLLLPTLTLSLFLPRSPSLFLSPSLFHSLYSNCKGSPRKSNCRCDRSEQPCQGRPLWCASPPPSTSPSSLSPSSPSSFPPSLPPLQFFLLSSLPPSSVTLSSLLLLGKADPYVVATYYRFRFKSKTIKVTLDPVWNERFTFDVDTKASPEYPPFHPPCPAP